MSQRYLGDKSFDNEFFEKFYPTITQSIDFFSEIQFFLGELEEKRNK